MESAGRCLDQNCFACSVIAWVDFNIFGEHSMLHKYKTVKRLLTDLKRRTTQSLQFPIIDKIGSETVLTLQSGQRGVFVPIDYDGVVQSRRSDWLYAEVMRRIDQDRTQTDRFVETLKPYLNHEILENIPDMESAPNEPYWGNDYFSWDDARFAFAFVATHEPSKIVEIGSGHSTRFFRKAINAFSTGTRIISIDPSPRANVDSVADIVITKSLLEVSLEQFDTLESGDLLFHDGSHITLNGTDTVCLFLEVLPRLKPGVVVHIHDIHLPYEYSSSFDGRGYSEQYMLASALLFSKEWEVLAPIRYLHSTGRASYGGGSFWMRKRAL
jgi:Methyltransferase domain